jgi:DNA-binding PadR family transcriptional regulator
LTYVNNSIYIFAENMPDQPRAVDPPLPLKPKVLHILLAVADAPRHGYGIMQDVLERTDGQVRLWPAALYGLLRELEKTALIVESDQRPSADQDDERRRYFALTPHGKRVLGAEVRRLEAIVHHARSSRALRKPQRA